LAGPLAQCYLFHRLAVAARTTERLHPAGANCATPTKGAMFIHAEVRCACHGGVIPLKRHASQSRPNTVFAHGFATQGRYKGERRACLPATACQRAIHALLDLQSNKRPGRMNGETRPTPLRLFRPLVLCGWRCSGTRVGKAELHRERPERINVCPFEAANLVAHLR
jgi:hypothetical protein